MRKKVYFIIVLLLLSVIGNILLYKNFLKLKKKIEVFRYEQISKEINIQINHGKKLSELTIFTDSVNINLKDIIKNEYLFIFRIPQGACNTCTDEIIPDIKDLSVKIGVQNVKYLLDKNLPNERYIFANKYDLPISSVILTKERLEIPFEGLNLPYALILDKELVIRCFFIPKKNDIQYNQIIMQFIEGNFF